MSRARFEADGLLHLSGVIGGTEVAAMRAEVERMLRRITLTEVVGALRPGPDATEALWAVGRSSAFTGLAGAVGAAVNQVFGPGLWEPIAEEDGGLAEPNLPLPASTSTWTVPHAAWHVDECTTPGQPRSWGLLAFALLDEIAPGGGGTVVITLNPAVRLRGEDGEC